METYQQAMLTAVRKMMEVVKIKNDGSCQNLGNCLRKCDHYHTICIHVMSRIGMDKCAVRIKKMSHKYQ